MYHSQYNHGGDPTDVDFVCPECDGTAYVDFDDTDDRVCRGCSAVVGRVGNWTPSYDVVCELRRLARSSGPYRREFHFNERKAQMSCNGPPSPQVAVDVVDQAFQREPEATFVPDTLTHDYVKSALRAAGLPKYAERWVEIRRRVCAIYGVFADCVVMRGWQWDEFTRRFLAASRAFDKLYYKAGSRRTRRDNLLESNQSELARHNMPNYNFVFHQILCAMGLRAQVRAHFFFHLPTTKSVLIDLYARWVGICAYVGEDWEPFGIDVITDEGCELDPPPMQNPYQVAQIQYSPER